MKMEIVNTDDLKKEIEEEVKPSKKVESDVKDLAVKNTDEIISLNLDNLEEKRNMIKSIYAEILIKNFMAPFQDKLELFP